MILNKIPTHPTHPIQRRLQQCNMKFKRHNNYITTLAVKYNQKFAHAQTQYIPLAVVKVADVLFDVVLGVGTVVEGEVGSFKVKMGMLIKCLNCKKTTLI